MAIELITGKGTTPHVDSADVGSYQAHTVGVGAYILNGCAATMANANTVSIAAGDLLVNGRHVRVTGSGNNFTIDNGQSGYKRNDIVAAHYTRDGSGVEDVQLVVIKGTPTSGTAVDPAMPTSGSILDNASDTHIPLWRVSLNGLTPSVATIANANPTANNTQGVLSPEHGGTGYNGNNLAPFAVLRANGTAGSGMRGVPTADGALYATGANKEPQFGTLLIGQGGTGGTTAKGACDNLNALYLGQGTVIPNSSDLNSYSAPGVYSITSGAGFETLINRPSFTGASNAGKVIVVRNWDSKNPMQTIIDSNNGCIYHRRYFNNAWSDWYAPTGVDSVIAHGTSSNWEYIKFANGIFICAQSRDVSSKSFPAFGNQFRTNAVTLSLPFKVKSAVVHTSGDGEVWGVASAAGNDTNTITAFYYSASNNSKAFTAYTLAMGRWK